MPKLKIIRKLSIPEGLFLIGGAKKKFIFGENVSVNTVKLKTYLYKGCFCYNCGKEAEYFAITKDKQDNCFLELFRTSNTGKPIPFTRDHVKALSKGGPNVLGNQQTMCSPCNQIKGNKEE